MQLPMYAIVPITALVPLILGFIWYHPKVFGTAWMNAAGVTPEDGKNMNMALVFGLTYVLSMLLCIALLGTVVHQIHLYSLFDGQPGVNEKTGEAFNTMQGLFTTYGDRFRTFKHGAFHGILTGVFFVLPIVGVNAMFERKGFKYIAINTGFWMACASIMGGLLCQFTKLY